MAAALGKKAGDWMEPKPGLAQLNRDIHGGATLQV